MPILFRCPHCGNQTQVADHYAGQTGPCSRCGQTVTVTSPASGAAAAAAPARSNRSVLIIVLVVVGAVLVVGVVGCLGLLYPAVQAARDAGRRTADTNNVRLIAIGLLNYHDVHGEFPPGTAGPQELPPEQQLSWMARLLPFVEMSYLHDELDFDQSWDAPANVHATRTPIPEFQSHYHARGTANTHFVGIGGLGVDAPTLPAGDPRAGFFGYNRITRLGDISDGISNTMIIADTHVRNGPWAQGGSATVRGLDETRKPYLGDAGQFGRARGAIVAFADGSARFIKAEVDAKVLEALSTIAGGEAVPPF